MENKRNIISDIKLAISHSRPLQALDDLESIVNNHMAWGISDKLENLKNHYQLMCKSVSQGMKDSKLDDNFNYLLKDIYSFFTLVKWHLRKERNQISMLVLGENPYFDADYYRKLLEDCHADELLGTPDYKTHQKLRDEVFNILINQPSWTTELTSKVYNMLMSETIDTKDKQIMVSAIMLSSLGTFDFKKLNLMQNVYANTSDVDLQQRALVGWALSFDDDLMNIFPEQLELAAEIMGVEEFAQDLFSLQIQLLLCLNAQQDNKVIRDEILPSMMQNMKMPTLDIKVIEDPEEIEDFLEREVAEEKLEELQDSAEKMMEMQKKGADIYFEGFASMKNYPFFSTVSNWFCPFYFEHPEMEGVYKGESVEIAKQLSNAMPFCDSDKYSFMFTLNMVIDKIPKNVIDILSHGDVKLFSGLENIAQNTISLRNYLQDLYRFFKICPMSKRFVDIFDNKKYLPFANQALMLMSQQSDMYVALAKMLLNKNRYSDLEKLISVHAPITDDTSFIAVAAKYYQTTGNSLKAEMCYRILYQRCPDNSSYLSGLARCCFSMEEYIEAKKLYLKVADLRPDDYKVQLNVAICMTYTEEYAAAIKLLAKLYYEHTDDIDVVRAFAWAYLASNNAEQAVKKYAEVLQQGKSIKSDDNFHMGLALWMAGNVNNAIDYFVEASSDSETDIEKAIRKEEDILYKYHISDVQTQIVIDLIRQRL